ncbi:MAG: hypothetical protein M1813_006367 [Trichoglossum hirsutum]|nr:MAG: hypothetical protein M1813_006367 [Trichoglossum hirsutum]
MNAYCTSWVLSLSGGLDDPRLLLPAWISIASALTVCYHITQRKINIKKEISASISVFSIASFTSMCALLLQLHLTREDAAHIPPAIMIRGIWNLIFRVPLDILRPLVVP